MAKLYKDAREYKYANVRRWTAPAKLKSAHQASASIMDCDLIIVPLHQGNHWVCAVADLANQRLIYMDSLKGRDPLALDMLGRYLEDEARDKKKVSVCFKCRVFAAYADSIGHLFHFEERLVDKFHPCRMRLGERCSPICRLLPAVCRLLPAACCCVGPAAVLAARFACLLLAKPPSWTARGCWDWRADQGCGVWALPPAFVVAFWQLCEAGC